MDALRKFLAGMPKAENHCHLDGSTSPESALYLAKKNGVQIPFSSVEEAEKLYHYGSLDDFLRVINGVCQAIQTAEDFAFLTERYAESAARQNIRYRDVMFSCYYHECRGISFETQMEGFIAGKRAAEEKYGVYLAAVPEIDRTMPPEESRAFIERLAPYREAANIVAVGLDSAEAGFPSHRHKAAFDRARELGYHVTAHAGEAYGPESVADSLDFIGATRIDHGVRAAEDPALVARLAREKILLTICPLSNVALMVYPDLQHHTFKKLLDAGVPVSVNSDDPGFFYGDLTENYAAVTETWRLTPQELLTIAKNAFTYSYAPAALKETWVAELETYFRQNQALLGQEGA